MDALTVWMVRHGPTHAKCLVGWTDLDADLSDRARVARLDAYLPRGLPIISSDLRRAVQTADALDAGRQRLPHDPGLREIGFGDWEMLRHYEIPPQALARRHWEQPGRIDPAGGGSCPLGPSHPADAARGASKRRQYAEPSHRSGSRRCSLSGTN